MRAVFLVEVKSTLPEIACHNVRGVWTNTNKSGLTQEHVNEFYQVRVMRWKGGWAARAAMPSLYTSLTPPARDPTNSWQAAPLRRGEGRLHHTMKLLLLATRRRTVLDASFLDQDDSNGHLNPQAGLSGHVRARA